MTRTFTEILGDGDLNLGFYCTIGGLPYIFADFDQPTHWTLPTGYTWSKTFVPYRSGGAGRYESSLKTISESIDWASGVTLTGNMDLEFLIDEDDPDDVWMNLVVPENRNKWWLNGEVVHKPSSTVWKVRSATSLEGTVLQVGDTIYCGPGTAEVVSRDGTNVTMEINKYGSFHNWNGPVGFQRGAPRGGDVDITNYPKIWKRRPVSVWVEFFGHTKGGGRIAISDDFKDEGGAGQEIFAGECATFPVWTANSPIVGLLCQGLEQPLSNPIIQRVRKYYAGPDVINMGSCYVDGGFGIIEYEIHEDNREFSGSYPTVLFSLQGTIDLRSSHTGYHNANTLGDAISSALEAEIFVAGQAGMKFEFSAQQDDVEAGDESVGESTAWKIRLEVSRWNISLSTRTGIKGTVRLRSKTSVYRPYCALRALGVEDSDLVVEPGDGYGWGDNPIPHYYLARNNQWLYYSGKTVENVLCDDPPLTQGTVNVDGVADNVYIRLGDKEIMEVLFRWPGTNALFRDADGRQRVLIIERSIAGQNTGPIVIEPDEREEDSSQIVIGLCFPKHDLFDVIRWILVSNGDPNTAGLWDDADASRYNVLPQGFGAAIPATRLATNLIENSRLVSFHPVAYGLWIEGALTAREFLSEIALTVGVNFMNVLDGSVRKLGSVLMEPPIDANAVLTIDNSWVDDSRKPVEPDYDELGIRNRLSFEYDYDPLEQKFMGRDNRFFDGNSVANYGMSDPLEIKIRWLSSFGDALSQMAGVAGALFRRFAEPLVGYQIPFVRPEGWQLSPGDVVLVNRDKSPNFRDGGLGLTNVAMRVEHVEKDLGPDEQFGNLRVAWAPGHNGLPWGPCFRIKSLVEGETKKYNVYSVASGLAFTPLEAGKEDLDFFIAGYRVTAYIPGIDSREVKAISVIDVAAGIVTLTGALTLDPLDGVVVRLNKSTRLGVPAGQFNHVYLSDADGVYEDKAGNRYPGARWV